MLHLGGEAKLGDTATVAVVCWKGWGTIVPYIQKEELVSLRVHLAFLAEHDER